MAAPDLRLIVITDAALAAPRAVDETVLAALEAGAPAIQLRNKDATPAELYQEALEVGDLTRRFGALLFVNDRLDVALAAHADGVHLGPRDLPVDVARKAVRNAGRADFLIGASTDQPATARRLARQGADYIGCGAVFGTTSKPGLEEERIGPEGLARVVESVSVPVVGIGGITPSNVAAVAAAGAAGSAAIGAVMGAAEV
ncbi:MAG: thiamine phosphate synthase, partial [Gemmatimonadetes bacterium]|nr:thiamine phosphate synthase [Gemmatimonadota bacterium]NIQ55345.1 thiamine phosphate synthase [Gemmatimonadota bacterium]NIU75550.1 thiamine phosphate synthase [Gammaproteobacteria bacterium]NIX44129.1 thiamine phosphate synthase [Gemmatimonadota bacterium]NIY09527.1 thiamine phosphate synthase [Gemmatimonadota bacterium]